MAKMSQRKKKTEQYRLRA